MLKSRNYDVSFKAPVARETLKGEGTRPQRVAARGALPTKTRDGRMRGSRTGRPSWSAVRKKCPYVGKFPLCSLDLRPKAALSAWSPAGPPRRSLRRLYARGRYPASHLYALWTYPKALQWGEPRWRSFTYCAAPEHSRSWGFTPRV